MSDQRSLHNKLAAVMEAVGWVPKNGVNQQQGYKFVAAADVADKVREELAKHHVTFLPTGIDLVESGQTITGKQLLVTVRVTWTITDGESGESISVQSMGAGADSGDKAIPKALTNSQKYAALLAFMVSTGDDPEAHDEPRPAPRPVAVPRPVTVTPAPADPLDLEDDAQWEAVMSAVKPVTSPPVEAAPSDEPYRHHGPRCPTHDREWKDTARGPKCTKNDGTREEPVWCKWQPSRKWLAAQEVAR